MSEPKAAFVDVEVLKRERAPKMNQWQRYIDMANNAPDRKCVELEFDHIHGAREAAKGLRFLIKSLKNGMRITQNRNKVAILRQVEANTAEGGCDTQTREATA